MVMGWTGIAALDFLVIFLVPQIKEIHPVVLLSYVDKTGLAPAANAMFVIATNINNGIKI